MDWLALLRRLVIKTAPIEEPVSLDVQLGPNFSLREMVRSGTARRLRINNTPKPKVVNALRLLVSNVLQPARNALGPISVTSGYRSPALNKAIGGARNSDHKYGRAADIVPTGSVTLQDLGKWIQTHCEFKQLILEHHEWLHVSYDPDNNRKQVLEAYYETKTVGNRTVRLTKYRQYDFTAQ